MYNMYGANSTNRLVTSLISLIGIIIFFVYTKDGIPSKKSFLKNCSEDIFNGKVDSIYTDVPNHNARLALLSSGYILGLYLNWDSKITVGDSLVKHKNSLIIEIYKDGQKKDSLNYVEVAHNFR